MSREQPKPPFPPQDLEKPGLEADMRPKPHYEAPFYRPAAKLHDKVALISGGDSGIGRAVAVLFAREGAKLALIYLPEEQIDAELTRAAIVAASKEYREEPVGPLLLPGDVRDPDFCSDAVERTISEFGRLDILVNNAAYQQHRDRIDQISDEEWDRTFKTNIYGYFYLAKAALKHLDRGACIINTGSITGLEGNAKLLDYSATKGAIHAFTKSLAQNLVKKGIRVNCVAPGPVWTPLNPAERPDEDMEDFGGDTPYGRPAQPEEIAPAYVFFASNADSSYITGEVLTLLGGDTSAA